MSTVKNALFWGILASECGHFFGGGPHQPMSKTAARAEDSYQNCLLVCKSQYIVTCHFISSQMRWMSVEMTAGQEKPAVERTFKANRFTLQLNVLVQHQNPLPGCRRLLRPVPKSHMH